MSLYTRGFTVPLILLAVVMAFIVAGGGAYYLNRQSGGTAAGLSSSQSPYQALFSCGKQLFEEVGAAFASDSLDAEPLAGDLIYILNRKDNELYLYTTSYAGESQLEIDKDGNPIPIGIGNGSHPTYQYNVVIPHLSSQTPGRGYFYMTINDLPYNGTHDSRINYSPRFIPGAPEAKPDFSKAQSMGPITITSYPQTTATFHQLTIEDEVWSSRTRDSQAVETFAKAVADGIGALYQATHMLCAGAGCQYYDANVKAQGDEQFNAVLATCQQAAQAENNQLILIAIQEARAAVASSTQLTK